MVSGSGLGTDDDDAPMMTVVILQRRWMMVDDDDSNLSIMSRRKHKVVAGFCTSASAVIGSCSGRQLVVRLATVSCLLDALTTSVSAVGRC